MKAGIIGLGLMGGSLGLALKESGLFESILGDDINEMHRRQAIYLGLVDECVRGDEIFDCDVIFISTPIGGIIKIIQSIKKLSKNQLVIDFGSSKKQILESIPSHLRANFVSLHPMCGTENFGPKAALKDLYKNQIVIFIDIEKSGQKQIKLAKKIFIKLGMNIIKMDSNAHDAHAALISHMPHIISYALANSVLKEERAQDIVAIAGGGFRSMSRLSKSSGNMWVEIIKHNKSQILSSITSFKEELENAITLIENNDFMNLEKWMDNANRLREIL